MSETQEQQIRKLRDKNKNGMEKWKENGMIKLMMVGEKCHATWSVMCSKMSVLPSLESFPKPLKIRPQT